MEALANQVLGFSKCVVVPITGPYRPALVDCVRTHIQALAPQWGTFQIKPNAEYLGVLLGPSTSEQYHKVDAKFWGVVSGISQANASAAISLVPYNAQAITVYSYKTQALPPLLVLFVERCMVCPGSCIFLVPSPTGSLLFGIPGVSRRSCAGNQSSGISASPAPESITIGLGSSIQSVCSNLHTSIPPFSRIPNPHGQLRN